MSLLPSLLPWRITLPVTAPLPDNSVWLFWFLQDTYLPTLPCLRNTTPSSSTTVSTQHRRRKKKRKAGVGQQLQYLQSRPDHWIFPPHPVLPQVNYCRQPTVHSFRRPQTADRRPQALRRSKPCLIGCDLHHAPPPPPTTRCATSTSSESPTLAPPPSHLSSPLSVLILRLSQHRLAFPRLSLPFAHIRQYAARSSDQIEFNNPPGQIRGPLPLRILPACHFCTRSCAYARACHQS